MQVADVRNAADHGFSIQFQHESEHAVRRRMLWTHVDQHVIGAQLGLHRTARVDGHHAAVLHRERGAQRHPIGVNAGSAERDLNRASGCHSPPSWPSPEARSAVSRTFMSFGNAS